jgi:hypothetical protein
MKKRQYSTPAASLTRVILESGLAQSASANSITLSSDAEWGAEEVLGGSESATEGGSFYANW